MTDVTGHDKVAGQDLFLVSSVLLSAFFLLFLSSSSVSLSYFNLAVPMRKYSREYSCTSSLFSIAILNGICSVRSSIRVKTFCTWSAIKLNSKKNLLLFDLIG